MKRVRCESSAAMVPKDKAIKRFIVRNMVDASAIRDLQDACAIDGGCCPQLPACAGVRCLLHLHLLLGRRAQDSHTPVRDAGCRWHRGARRGSRRTSSRKGWSKPARHRGACSGYSDVASPLERRCTCQPGAHSSRSSRAAAPTPAAPAAAQHPTLCEINRCLAETGSSWAAWWQPLLSALAPPSPVRLTRQEAGRGAGQGQQAASRKQPRRASGNSLHWQQQ